MTDLTPSQDQWSDLERLAKAATPGEWRQGRIGDPVGGEHVVDLGDPPKSPYFTFSKGYHANNIARGWSPSAIGHSDGDNVANDAAFIAALNPATALKLIEAARANSVGTPSGVNPDQMVSVPRDLLIRAFNLLPISRPRREIDELLAAAPSLPETAGEGVREAVEKVVEDLIIEVASISALGGDRASRVLAGLAAARLRDPAVNAILNHLQGKTKP